MFYLFGLYRDDGYAAYASLTAIRALQDQGIPFARCVVIIEACEESGSYDLPYYIDHLESRIGQPSLVICLDAECGNYDQLWCTTSLRGNIIGTLEVEVLTEGVHSGGASGIVPSSFRIARSLRVKMTPPKTEDTLPSTRFFRVAIRIAPWRASSSTSNYPASRPSTSGRSFSHSA